MIDGESDLNKLIKGLSPKLNDGEYVFTSIKNIELLNTSEVICTFKEKEGFTLILERSRADQLGLRYNFIASWITLEVHSSLNAVGLTSLFTTELADNGISCNVIAGYYHDHIFVSTKDSLKTLGILKHLSLKIR
tara:strand:- start:1014 stop:1418 length:405 start_codon:yes stop_codon:yes gene_type:complete